jgi:hypothetical protein
MEDEFGYPQKMGGFWKKRDADQTLYALLTDEGHRNRNQRIHREVVLGLADHALGYTTVDSGQGRAQATVHWMSSSQPRPMWAISLWRTVRLCG